MKCLVIQSTGKNFRLHTEEGKIINGLIKGNFRLQNFSITNPIVVGDYVEVEPGNEHWITKIYPRRNYIIRRSTNLSKQAHVLASNVDQMLLFITYRHPTTSFVFVDRILATAEAYRIPVILLFNKIDLLDEKDIAAQIKYIRLYEKMGYTCVTLSALNLNTDNRQQKKINDILTNKITLLAGNSGVGKSTLINTFLGDNLAKVSPISQIHDLGMHTTTFSQMYLVINDNSWIIDTPGVKSFGMVEMKKEEIDHYFRDIFSLSGKCKYANCLHVDEKDCAVKNAVQKNELPLSRYESYLSLLEECHQRKYRQGAK